MAFIAPAQHMSGKACVKEFFEKHAVELQLELLAGREGLERPISFSEVERPGLSLGGYAKGSSHRMLIFGQAEMHFLTTLERSRRKMLLSNLLFPTTPGLVLSRSLSPSIDIIEACEEKSIPLFGSPFPAMELMSGLFRLLKEESRTILSCHGSLVEVFGVGILIQGDAAVGKSETALGLIQRGHRLVSDDIVKVRKREGDILEGFGVDISRHHMELKGLGIINVVRLYGIASVVEKKNLDIVVKLEVWNDRQFYDHTGLKENKLTLLDVDLPFHLIPVTQGRDIVLFIETIAMTHRLNKLTQLEQKERGGAAFN